VARRIVRAIRTGLNPGRFLRKGKDGKWHQVSDKEAAWKASQALREKTRWSSMRQDKDGPESPAAAATTDALTGQQVVETASTTTAEKAKKGSAADERVRVDCRRKLGTNYMLPPNMNTSTDFFPRDEDVLFGRGGRTNHHPGNVRLRTIVNNYRYAYNQAKKVDKPQVSRLIVSALRKANPPSRFLRHNEDTGRWEDVGDKRAAEKVSQTLREKDQDTKADSVARKSEPHMLSETQSSDEIADAEEVGEIQLPSPEKAQTADI